MSYTDKCCGVCDEYVEMREVVKDRVYKRFYNDVTNVCTSCIENKALKASGVEKLTLHKMMEEPRNITKGFTWFIDPETNVVWKCHNSFLGVADGIKLKFSKAAPRAYEVLGEGINHEGLFTHGGIYSRDKRVLRRTLRKLGVTGKIELLVK